ncbi:MAG: hypothetical protein D6698_14370 [Gammaproteobacteria bacterium]|nr:MAG: hypothetical protein D6698_14370 [Gammaproteobacteria bacterium]
MQLVETGFRQLTPYTSSFEAKATALCGIIEALINRVTDQDCIELGRDKEDLRVNDIAFLYNKKFRKDSGKHGVCWEYSILEAVRQGNHTVLSLLNEAIAACNPQESWEDEIDCVLWGGEKHGDVHRSALEALGPEAKLWTPGRGRPIRLDRHLDTARSAFNQPSFRDFLPAGAADLWQTDLFVRKRSSTFWYAVSVKWNLEDLKRAAGVTIGIVRIRRNESYFRPAWDDAREMVVCRVPYHYEFGEAFHTAFALADKCFSVLPRTYGDFEFTNTEDGALADFMYNNRSSRAVDVLYKLRQQFQDDAEETIVIPQGRPELIRLHAAPIIELN